MVVSAWIHKGIQMKALYDHNCQSAWLTQKPRIEGRIVSIHLEVFQGPFLSVLLGTEEKGDWFWRKDRGPLMSSGKPISRQ